MASPEASPLYSSEEEEIQMGHLASSDDDDDDEVAVESPKDQEDKGNRSSRRQRRKQPSSTTTSLGKRSSNRQQKQQQQQQQQQKQQRKRKRKVKEESEEEEEEASEEVRSSPPPSRGRRPRRGRRRLASASPTSTRTNIRPIKKEEKKSDNETEENEEEDTATATAASSRRSPRRQRRQPTTTTTQKLKLEQQQHQQQQSDDEKEASAAQDEKVESSNKALVTQKKNTSSTKERDQSSPPPPQNTRSSPRRRQRQRISYKEESDDPEEEEEEEKDNDSHEEDEDGGGGGMTRTNNKDNDEDYDSNVEEENKKDEDNEKEEDAVVVAVDVGVDSSRKSKRRKQNSVATTIDSPTTKSSKTKLLCPHCNKAFSSPHNLKYHIDNYVCRKDQMPKEKKKAKKNDDDTETEYDDDDDDEEVGGKKRKRSSSANLTCPHCNKSFTSTQRLKYHVDNKVCTQPPKKKPPPEASTRRASSSSKKSKQFRGPEAERICPKCNRIFTSVLGKDYHVKNRVCEQTKNQKINKGGGKQFPFGILQPGSEFVTKFGIVRVVQDSRAIPTAKLTKENEKKLKTWKGAKQRLDVKRRDQYSKVTVHSLARRRRLNEIYQQSIINGRDDVVALTDLPKLTWNAYFGSTNLDDPREGGGHWNFPKLSPEFPPEPYPMEPEGSYADRIVECVLIKDRRKLIECYTVVNAHRTWSNKEEFIQREIEPPPNDDDDAATTTTVVPSIKLYIERRQLTQEYNENGSRFRCADCGRIFVSVVGCKHHVMVKSCHNIMGRKGDKYETPDQIRNGLERRSEILMEAQERLLLEEKSGKALYGKNVYDESSLKPTDSSEGVDPATRDKLRREKEIQEANKTIIPPERIDGHYAKQPKRKWVPKKKRPLAYYPQVWRTLGFKVVPKAPRAAPVSFFKTRKKKKNPDVIYTNAPIAEKVQEKDDLANAVKSLKEELIKIQSEELGAYYPSVWKVLRFRKPGANSSSTRSRCSPNEHDFEEDNSGMAPIGQQRAVAPPRFVPKPPPFHASAVIIDISVLAGEIDAGRYPSIKRNKTNPSEDGDGITDNHEDHCFMCKDSRGLLYLCDFCTNVNHLECLRTRFIIKDPEPHDDFMCNKCIQCVVQRRRRAEKRRKQKNLCDGASDNAVEANAAASKAEKNKEPDDEYDALALQNQHVGDILELIRDSQSRLQQLVETSKINDFRRSLFE